MDEEQEMLDGVQRSEPSDDDKRLFELLSSKEGKFFLEWLQKKTIERQLGFGVQDGVQTAILTARELGRHDVYHELKSLINRVLLYVNRK